MSALYEGLADIFEVDVSDIRSDTALEEYGWDSLAIVSTIALFDEIYSKEIGAEALKNCQTVGDLESLAGE